MFNILEPRSHVGGTLVAVRLPFVQWQLQLVAENSTANVVVAAFKYRATIGEPIRLWQMRNRH